MDLKEMIYISRPLIETIIIYDGISGTCGLLPCKKVKKNKFGAREQLSRSTARY
jgi:hypothetical protein